ncbi:MAG: methyltransferase domain-containing protein [Acidobacteriota bacterium]
MKHPHAGDWEELARREPYFAVLTDQGLAGVEANHIATAAFLETGEADIAALMTAIASLLHRELHPASSLDFGCGAGRLTLPLARRSRRVVACDIAPTMLEHARQNAEEARLENVIFVLSDELGGLPDGSFDFVSSLLVFQYIQIPDGYGLIRTLLRLLAPGGVAALHVMLERPRGRLRRMARAADLRSRMRNRPLDARPEPKVKPGYLETNEYDETILLRHIEASGARLAGTFAQHGAGVVLVVEKLPPTA